MNLKLKNIGTKYINSCLIKSLAVLQTKVGVFSNPSILKFIRWCDIQNAKK